jgi:hypothetical protein
LIIPSLLVVGVVPVVAHERLESIDSIPTPPGFTTIDDSENCLVTSCLDKEIDVLVLGDSHAGVIAELLRADFEDQGLATEFGITGGCPILLSDRIISNNPDCQAIDARARELLRTNPPQLVILHSYTAGYFSTVFSGRTEPINLITAASGAPVVPEEALESYAIAFSDTLELFTELGIPVFVITDVPDFPYPPDETFRNEKRLTQWEYFVAPWLAFDNGQTVAKAEYRERHGGFRDIELDLATRTPGVYFIDSWDYVCDSEQCSQVTTRGTYVYSDWDHLSAFGASLLAQGVLAEIKGSGVLDSIVGNAEFK